jgi:hypothetical protein
LSYYGYDSVLLRQLLEEKSARVESYDELEFVGAIEEIDGILSRMHNPSSALMQAVDVKGQDYSTYYYAAYADTRDLDASLAAYDRVRNLVRIIVLMDRYFEVGNQRYRRLGQALMTRFRKEADNNLKNILRFNMKQFWPFWKFENHTKTLMQQGHRFTLGEVRAFNLFKSSDAALLYAPVLEASLPNFNHNAALIIHYNQALQDIDDDLDDIQEDLRDQMPNIFILASLGSSRAKSYSQLYKHRLNGSRVSILENASGTVLDIVNEYEAMIAGIDLSEQFRFLKFLSRSYAGRIRKKLPIRSTQRHRLEVA